VSVLVVEVCWYHCTVCHSGIEVHVSVLVVEVCWYHCTVCHAGIEVHVSVLVVEVCWYHCTVCHSGIEVHVSVLVDESADITVLCVIQVLKYMWVTIIVSRPGSAGSTRSDALIASHLVSDSQSGINGRYFLEVH